MKPRSSAGESGPMPHRCGDTFRMLFFMRTHDDTSSMASRMALLTCMASFRSVGGFENSISLLVVGFPVSRGYVQVVALPEDGDDAHVGSARYPGLLVIHDADPVLHLPVLSRILWINRSNYLTVYRFIVVSLGACASFCFWYITGILAPRGRLPVLLLRLIWGEHMYKLFRSSLNVEPLDHLRR